MANRRIENLEHLSQDEAPASQEKEAEFPLPGPPTEMPAFVDVNYPYPTLLSTVLRDVSRWSGRVFVMEPKVNTKIQIFAGRKVTPEEAYKLLLSALSVVRLRAVAVDDVIKIVPQSTAVVA